jgi:IclR family mhp operon transcriptional activator
MRAVERTLAVLRALAERGGLTALELSRATAIPRPAVYRILAALGDEGFVRRHAGDNRFRLTALIQSIGSGFREEDALSSAAFPVLRDLCRQVIWPVDFAIVQGGAVILRDTTRAISPMVIDRAAVGWHLPILPTALGRAYLAFCPGHGREAILDLLRRSGNPWDGDARNRHAVARLVAETRRRGYAVRYKSAFMPEIGSVAIPLQGEDRIHGSIGITFIASATSPGEIAAAHLDALRDAARAIVGALADARG